MIKIEKEKIDNLKLNENNPRTISDDNFEKLKQSIKGFSKMLELRPLVVDDNNVVMGGNMRLQACIELGLDEVPIIRAKNFTEDELKEFIAKDNIGYGEWDYEALLEQYDLSDLEDYGIDIPNTEIKIDNDTEYKEEKVDYSEYTLYFESEQEEEIWFGFLSHLKNKFKDIESVSERVMCYIQKVYEENDMSESKMILEFLKCDKEVMEDD